MFASYKRYWKNYFRFKETAGSGEVWWPILIHLIINVIFIVIINALGTHPGENIKILGFVYAAFLVVTCFGTLFAIVRRLKTVGEPWPKIFIGLVPLFGWIYVAVLVSQKDLEVCKSKGHLFGDVPDTCTEKCARCGEIRTKHDYDGCKCKKCGAVQNKGHAFTKFDKEHCTETCEKCGATRARHSFKGCKCTVCGKQRDEGHDFQQQLGCCTEVCSVCGKQREGKHAYDASGICTVCGKKKPDPFNLSSLTNAEYESVKYALDIIGKTPGIDIDLGVRCRTLRSSISPNKALTVVDMATVVGASLLVGKAISSDSRLMNGTDVNALISKMHVINTTNAVGKINKIIEAENNATAAAKKAQASAPVSAPSAAPSDTFAKKPLSAFASYDESYKGYVKGGVCDVCNKPLEGKKAYAVDNQTFYDSPDYYAHLVKLQKDTFGFNMTRADYEQRRKMDTSPGSAVCENCMHMFAVMPGDKSSASDAAIFYEADNVGSRHDSMGKATGYWLGERPNKAVKPPFTMYVMPSLESGETALLELPFFHRAKDSGKIVSERLMTFGVYEVTENGKPTGKYEALVCGTDLTREEFEKAEAAFEKNGGKRKSNQAPEGSPVPCLATNGNAANVRFKEKLANGSGTYFVNTAPTKSDALAFLKKERVDRPATYIVVDTPEGNIGRDINGIYEE